MDTRSRLVLEMALKREHRAYNAYGTLSKSSVEAMQPLYTRLAIEELRHVRLIELTLKYNDFKKAKEEVSKEDFSSINVDKLIDLHINMRDVLESLRFSIREEEKTYYFYKKEEEEIESGPAHDLLVFLEEEEVRHRALLENEKAKFIRNYMHE